MSALDLVPARAPDRRKMRVAIGSGAVGTAVEFYDFFIYGTASALVLNRLFFPNVSPALGTMAAFATFSIGFVVRPLGAVVLGHVGDRIGRKRALLFSLLLMGAATVGVGCLPTYQDVGMLAPVLLVTLRLIQGLALGGEWGGAAVLASEFAPRGRRGFLSSFVQTGSPMGLLLSSGVFALVGLGPDAFVESWGWRIPFWASLVLVAIGLYIRLNVEESPEFRRAQAGGEMDTGKPPVVEAFRHSWRQVLTAIALRFAPDIGFYLAAVFLIDYAVSNGGFTSAQILVSVAVAAACEIATIPLFGRLSDRIGRRRVSVIGILVWIGVAFPLFQAIEAGSGLLTGVFMVVALAVGHSACYSVAPSLYSEMFPTRYRTTGAALGMNMSNIVGGGPAPTIAAALVIAAGGLSWPVSTYLVVGSLLSLAAVLTMAETAGRDLSTDRLGAAPAPAAGARSEGLPGGEELIAGDGGRPGALVIWNDIDAEHEADFNEWYTHEHLPERVGIPGFLRGRRFRRVLPGALPAYLVFYEVRSTDVLASAPYIKRLNAPTESTRKLTALFCNATRTVCDIPATAGEGRGRFAAALVLPCAQPSPPRERLVDILADVADRPAVRTVRLCAADPAATGAKEATAEHATMAPTTRVERFVMVEATSQGAAEQALSFLAGALADGGEQQGGVFELIAGLEHEEVA